MYLLIRYAGLGVYAVAWTTVVVMCVINFITNPLYMAHVLHLPYGTFYPDIIKNVIACAALVLLYQGLSLLYMPGGWISLALTGLVYAAVGTPVHFLIVCDQEQRQVLWKMIRERKKG